MMNEELQKENKMMRFLISVLTDWGHEKVFRFKDDEEAQNRLNEVVSWAEDHDICVGLGLDPNREIKDLNKSSLYPIIAFNPTTSSFSFHDSI